MHHVAANTHVQSWERNGICCDGKAVLYVDDQSETRNGWREVTMLREWKHSGNYRSTERQSA